MQMKYPYFMDLWERGENRQDFISKEVFKRTTNQRNTFKNPRSSIVAQIIAVL